MDQIKIDWQTVDKIIDNALQEDVKTGDVTTNTLFTADAQASAYMLAKQAGIVAGLPIAERVFQHLDAEIKWIPLISEGNNVTAKTKILEVKGKTRALLTGERLALNILQRLSGIATTSNHYVKALKGLSVEILDTRKTLPGLRVLEKYAVAVGGATNHRFGLFDAVMIKDNHIKLYGTISDAVQKIRENNPDKLSIEVETSTITEVETALTAKADIIMLDNMSNEMMAEAVKLINHRAKVEASGGITLERIHSIAQTGVDYISVGALTHSVSALDIGFYFE